MIEIKTYFRVNNDFIPLEKYFGSFNDIDYIEGAIILSINSILILSLETWDYVDQMWGYLINGLEGIMSGQDYFTYFPDQPIGLSFKLVGDSMVKVRIDYEGGKTSVIPKNAFVSALCADGYEFFQKMIELVPAHKGTWLNYLDKIEVIKKQTANKE